MHIMEGFLPVEWSAFWYALAVPVLIYGAWKVKKEIDKDPKAKSLIAVSLGFIFVLSALKLPSVTGSCSHPTGTGVAVVLFGPSITAFLSSIALLYQALLLAHGGLTTLGANTVSMGIVGPFFGLIAYKAFKKFSLPVAFFSAAAIADFTTYVVTSFQLALAFPAFPGVEGVLFSAIRFLGIFAVTQVPLAIFEGVIAVILLRSIKAYSPEVSMA